MGVALLHRVVSQEATILRNKTGITAVHPWVAHRPQDLNQPRMSSGHTARNAAPIASETASVVRAAADRSHPLTFENISSIGVRSGRYGGNGIKLAPAPSTA